MSITAAERTYGAARPQEDERYEAKKQRLIRTLRSSDTGEVRLGKETSNLFRDRAPASGRRLDVRDFNRVIRVDPDAGWVEVEGMTPYADLVDATLPHGVMPAVVPELKSITIGGAVSGVGIESSSFKYGLVHETIREMEVLLGDGRVVLCAPDNEYRDLFYGLPNSYGTLGYALKLRADTIPVRPYVEIRHLRYRHAEEFFQALDEWCDGDVDFVDGTVFGTDELYLNIGRFVDAAPYTSDYTFRKIYYRSIRDRELDYLTTPDYIWRWDTDWFWCSKNLYAQNALVRLLLGRRRLGSVTYTKVMRWNSKWGLTGGVNRMLGWHTESVIQDVDVPIANAPAFLEFFHREIGISPIWICPVRAYDKDAVFDLFPMDPQTTYVNFGFWDVVKDRTERPSGYYNRKVERKVAELGGIKSLYSDAYYTREEFWSHYNRAAYERLKSRYDPQGSLKDLYRKCVLRE